jgi:hypothetical protein
MVGISMMVMSAPVLFSTSLYLMHGLQFMICRYLHDCQHRSVWINKKTCQSLFVRSE